MNQPTRPAETVSSERLFGAWQTIETAPKDFTMLLLYRPTASDWAKVTVGRWEDDKYAKHPKPYWEIWLKIGGKMESREWLPTHWMPLPVAPNKGI